MLLSSYRRTAWRRAIKIVLLILPLLLLLDFARLLSAYKTFSINLAANTVYDYNDLPHTVQGQKIYIAAQFWTSEYVLWDQWMAALLRLVKELGPSNVYVSILESGSLDGTATLIHYLDGKLGEMQVERTIVTDPTTHEDLVNGSPYNIDGSEKSGWIFTGNSTPPHTKELRRIPYLADLRNKGLEPLLTLHRNTGRVFDKILFLNDVYFATSDVLSLLATNAGHYDVACGLDFHHPPVFYDTFAVRDMDKRGPVMSVFPYFRAQVTRQALLQGLPARVTSCWNGMLAMDAAPFYDVPGKRADGLTTLTSGLRFRGLPDSLAVTGLEASECCLIHADLIARDQAKKGIFINPAARSGYERAAWNLTHRPPDDNFVSSDQYVAGIYRMRLARWKTDGISSSAGQRMGRIYDKIARWREEGHVLGEKREEVGDYCAIEEMHILIWNGWKHVW